jgi:CDP-diacylglycerol--glycerol-3-phosphate 3-phosphatidyltransferase
MPSLYALKPAFQRLLRPMVNRLAAIGITANNITVQAAVLSITGGLAVAALHEWRPVLLLVPAVLFVRMALNAIDGMLAREHGQASTLGMYLNEVLDVVSDLALILPFAALPIFPAWAVIAFAMSAMLTEFTGVLGIAAGVGRNYVGPFGKSDRACALGLVAILCAVGLWPASLASIVFPTMATLSLLTAINRIRAGLNRSLS